MSETNKEQVDGQLCPLCRTKNLSLSEECIEIPYFDRLFVFSMTCSNCDFHKSDVEAAEQKEPCKFDIEIDSEEDMNIRFVKSSEATVKIPHVVTITPGAASEGFVTNIEGLLNRVRDSIKKASEMTDSEDKAARKKAKNLLKKIQKVKWGQENLKITLEDPTGNSAIISEKAVKKNLRN